MVKTVQHNATLDGLRGVAALSIVVFHLSMGKSSGAFPYRGYLAVDFFFLLSGFVLAKAYEQRLCSGLTVWNFMAGRIIRLYPLIFLGMTAGAAAIIFDMFKGLSGTGSISQLCYVFLWAALLLPALGHNAATDFPLDTPAWSLMFELLVNLAYSLIVKALTSKRLAIIVGLIGIVLVLLCFLYNGMDFGVDKTDFLPGVARVTFSFGFGVLLFRALKAGWLSWVPQISGLSLAFVLVLSFLPGDVLFGWLYDAVCVMVIYPTVIVCGASDALPVKFVPVSLLAGRLSYPIYALHVPIVVQHFGRFNEAVGIPLFLAISVATLSAVVIAWLALKLYDEPIRKLLNAIVVKRNSCAA